MWYLGKLEFSQHFGAMKIHAAMFKLDGLFDNARGAVYAKGEGGRSLEMPCSRERYLLMAPNST